MREMKIPPFFLPVFSIGKRKEPFMERAWETKRDFYLRSGWKRLAADMGTEFMKNSARHTG